jgi:hypothetical protein
MKKLILYILILIAFPYISISATHYIRPSGGGGGGTSWTDAYNGLPATMVRGDTYVVAGGTYTSSHTFNDAMSGSTYIYIRKANDAQDSGVAGWSASYGSNQAVFSSTGATQWTFTQGYYDFDGVTPTTKWASTGYGIKVIPGNMDQTNTLFNGDTDNARNLIFRRMEVVGGTNTAYTNMIFQTGGDAGVLDQLHGWTIQYCYVHDFSTAFRWAGVHKNIIEYSYIKDSYSPSGGDHSETYGIVASGYHITRFNLFENTNHSTGMAMTLGNYTQTGATNSYLEFYGNVFVDCSGGGNGLFGTADSGSNVTPMNGWKIYNNTFVRSPLQISPNSVSPATGWILKNNLLYGSNTSWMNDVPLASYTVSNNYFNSSAKVWNNGTGDISSSESTSVLFANYAGGNFTLGSGSQTRNAGANLGTPYDTDPDGNTRGSDGTWDIGAYEYGAGGDVTAPVVTITTIDGSANQSATYSTSSSTVTLAGTASDAVGVTSVTWSNDRGGSGTATCANCDGTAGTKDWSQSGITLQSGENIITIYGADAVPNTGTDVLTVTYTPSGDVTPPVCIINNPTTNTTWPTSSATITVGGSATDGVGVTSISWACPTCTPASGTATCSGCTGQSVTWSQLVALSSGANTFTATATDGTNTHADAIVITYTPVVVDPPSSFRGINMRGVYRR